MGTKKGLGDLGNMLKKVRFSIEENADKELRRVALLFDQQVVQETPVDTGRAKGNWVVGINEPNREIPIGKTKSTKNTKRDGAAAVNTITDGQVKQIEREQLTMARNKITNAGNVKSIVISNNLPYIGRLNDGYSEQAGKNFVGIALKGVLSAIKTIKLIKEK